MWKILLPLFGLTALASTASAEPIPMKDDQLDLVVAGLNVTYTSNGEVHNLELINNGALTVKAEDGTVHIIPLSLPISSGELLSPAFLEALKTSVEASGLNLPPVSLK